MPNGREPSVVSLGFLSLDFIPVNFHFIFRVDAEGKCRLQHGDEDWKDSMKYFRADWQQRLVKLLRETGTPQDWQNAKEWLSKYPAGQS
jgi:hypothetical protein